MKANPENVVGINPQYVQSNPNEFIAASGIQSDGEVRLVYCHDIDVDVVTEIRHVVVPRQADLVFGGRLVGDAEGRGLC